MCITPLHLVLFSVRLPSSHVVPSNNPQRCRLQRDRHGCFHTKTGPGPNHDRPHQVLFVFCAQGSSFAAFRNLLGGTQKKVEVTGSQIKLSQTKKRKHLTMNHYTTSYVPVTAACHSSSYRHSVEASPLFSSSTSSSNKDCYDRHEFGISMQHERYQKRQIDGGTTHSRDPMKQLIEKEFRSVQACYQAAARKLERLTAKEKERRVRLRQAEERNQQLANELIRINYLCCN